MKKKPDTNDDEEFEDLEDPEMVSENVTPRSDDEFKLEIDRLRQRLTELESHRVTQQSQKRTEVPREVTFGSYREPSPRVKSMNPVEGKMLGTFNGRTDLDTFLVRFRTCSRNFKWSETEKVFYLMNALTGPAESLVKEVGDEGTLEDIMKLLQSRFGTRCKLEKFRTELKNRRRGPDETLQEFYLDLCRLRANAYDNDPNEKFQEIFFRNIFVDALGDRELRRAILIQEPNTMEAAYNVAMKLEAIDDYQTLFRDGARNKPKVRQLDQEFVDPLPVPRDAGKQTQAVGNQRLVELEELVRAQNAAINEMRQVTESLRQASYFPNMSYTGSQTNPQPMQNPGSKNSGDRTFGGGSVSNYRDPSVPTADGNQRMRRAQCFNCGLPGHYSRDCRKPKRRDDGSIGRETNRHQPRNQANPAPRSGSDTVKVLDSSTKIRKEAYLEVQLGTKKILALLDSGCEQSVIGRNLIRKIPLEPTREKLSTADGTDVPLLGETTIEFLVSGFQSKCRVVVSEALDELILGIE